MKLREEIATVDQLQRYYSVQEIAESWQLSKDKVRELFRNEDGVLRIPSSNEKRGQRAYETLRVPACVLARVQARLSSPVAAKVHPMVERMNVARAKRRSPKCVAPDHARRPFVA